jgi:hypothetical protein
MSCMSSTHNVFQSFHAVTQPPNDTALPHAAQWHVGLDHPSATPHGRGFDTSKGYLTAAEDHWTQAISSALPATSGPATSSYPPSTLAARAGFGNGSNVIDLWCTDGPCTGDNGTSFHM